MNTKVRYVRCPRCRNVLPEPAEVPVYKCGGCDAVLQAKKRKNGTVDTTSRRLKEDSLGKRQMEQVSDDQEAGSCSNQQLLVNSIDEPGRNSDHNDLRSSIELSIHEDPESSLEATAHNRMDGDQDAAKKAENGTVDAPSGGVKENSSGKQKMEQLSDDQEAGSSSNQQLLVNSIDDPDRNSDCNDLRSSTEISGHEDPESLHEATAHNRMNQDEDAAKKAENSTVDAPSGGVEEYSSSKWKMEQLSDDQEACSSSHQQSLVNSIDEPDRNSDHNDPRSSTELSGHEDPESSPEATAHNRMDQDQDAAKKQKNVIVDATSGGLEHSSGKQKMEQLSDDQEDGSRLNQQSLVDSINEPDRNSDHDEPRSSSELSYHEDPESSPEAAVHSRIDQDHNQDHHHNQEQGMFTISGVFEICRNGAEFEESSRELTASPEKCSFSELNEIEEPSREAIANTKIVRDFDGGSKSTFKSLIAEKLLDTRQRKVVYLDEDDTLSEDGSADLCHRRRLKRNSSVETLENARFGGTSYYGYEGSVSSFDGNDNQVPRKNRIGSKGDQPVDSGIGYHCKRRHEFHPLNRRWDKDEHRSMDVQSFYGNFSPSRLGLNDFQENPRRRSPVIPENAKMERLELLKMVRELQDQLERTNVSNAARQVPSYYNHILNHPGRYDQRMAFSGEAAAVNGRRDGSSCYHCCPQERHFSAQLPRQCVCCNGSHYMPSTCYSSRCSGPLSPQHHSESEFFAPVRSKAEPDDHRHRNDIPKPYRSPKKRYVRPIAGGSPWITCYRCSNLLELPQSFLVYKRRYHSLRCGACLKVLKFTLSNGSHVNRYYPEEMIAAPPSSEVEDYANSTASRAGPVSCSDRSFQKSCSTETDRNGSREFIEERRKATMSRDPSDSARPSSSKISGRKKTTSEIEEIEPASSGSPLHWLMGYASPSKVIRG